MSFNQIESMYDFSRQSGHRPEWLPAGRGSRGRSAFKTRIEAGDKATDLVFFRQGPVLRAEAPWFPLSAEVDGDFHAFLMEYYLKLDYTTSEPALYSYDESKKQIIIFTESLTSIDHAAGIQFYTISRETMLCKCEEFSMELSMIETQWNDYRAVKATAVKVKKTRK